MPVGPRVVFMRFLDDESPKLAPWISHATRVIGDRSVAPLTPNTTGNQGRSVWQLVSANNRQLARGVGVHESFELARIHAQHVVDSGPELSLEFVSESGRGVYGWFASFAGVPVMTCARWYLTDRDRRHSGDLATRSISSALLLAGARLTDPSLMGGHRGAAI